jgi:V/A-type H+/Na+-transporting ATPase subunit K
MKMADATSLVTGAGGIAIGAGLAIGLGAVGAGISQGALGSSALGIVAERPEFEKNILIYIVLPEILVVFGFLMAILLWLKMG